MEEKFMNNLEQYKIKYQKFGTTYIKIDDGLFTVNEIKDLKQEMTHLKEEITILKSK